MVKHNDDIGILDRRQTVSNDKYRSALHQSVHACLYNLLGSGIDGRSCFIQDHDRRIGDGCSGNGQQLALSLRQIAAISSQHGLIALWQMADKTIRTSQLGSGNTLTIRCVQSAIADIIHDGTGK